MQVFATCMVCLSELGHPSPEAFFLPYYDDRIAYVTCARGHKSALIVQSTKFEVLLEAGANSLADGQTLEAATSFATALERFYEFCVEVFCTHREMPYPIYQRMFKDMARQSERQIGAFLVLHAAELGYAYEVNSEIAQFRNGVIHKGTIPNPEQASKFCGMIYKEIWSLSKILSSKYTATYNEVIFRDLKERAKQIPDNMPRATSTGTIFFRSGKETFQEAYEQYVHGRNMIRLAPSLLPIFSNALASRTRKPDPHK